MTEFYLKTKVFIHRMKKKINSFCENKSFKMEFNLIRILFVLVGMIPVSMRIGFEASVGILIMILALTATIEKVKKD